MLLIEQRPELSCRELEDYPDARHVCQTRVNIIVPSLLGALCVPPFDLGMLPRFLFGGASLDRPPDEKEVTSSLELTYSLDKGDFKSWQRKYKPHFCGLYGEFRRLVRGCSWASPASCRTVGSRSKSTRR